MVLLQIVGSIAFSISGAVHGIKYKCDLFGVIVLGLTVTVGGGIMRDVILGFHPPKIFFDLIYVFISMATSIVTYLLFKIKKIEEKFYEKRYQGILNIIDAIGLGVFTAVASTIVINMEHSNIVLMIAISVITSCGGGVLRDIFVGKIPTIFKEDIYALTSVSGAMLFYILQLNRVSITISVILTTILVVVLRVVVFHLRNFYFTKDKKYHLKKESDEI